MPPEKSDPLDRYLELLETELNKMREEVKQGSKEITVLKVYMKIALSLCSLATAAALTALAQRLFGG